MKRILMLLGMLILTATMKAGAVVPGSELNIHDYGVADCAIGIPGLGTGFNGVRGFEGKKCRFYVLSATEEYPFCGWSIGHCVAAMGGSYGCSTISADYLTVFVPEGTPAPTFLFTVFDSEWSPIGENNFELEGFPAAATNDCAYTETGEDEAGQQRIEGYCGAGVCPSGHYAPLSCHAATVDGVCTWVEELNPYCTGCGACIE